MQLVLLMLTRVLMLVADRFVNVKHELVRASTNLGSGLIQDRSIAKCLRVLMVTACVCPLLPLLFFFFVGGGVASLPNQGNAA